MFIAPWYSCLFILACGGAQSAFFVIKRPWSQKVEKSTQFDASHVSTSPLVSSSTLGVWRLACFAYIVGLGVRQFARVGSFIVKYYTIWNWWLLATYFLISGIIALKNRQNSKKDVPSKVSSLAAYAATALFHVNVTTVALVDTVTWLVLLPMLSKNPDPTHVAFMNKMLFNFTSYNQHGFNAVLIFVDLVLNNIPFCHYMVGYAGLWSLVFGVWAMVWHRMSGKWLYPFLDTSRPWAPVAYLSLYLVHFVYFGTAYVLILSKQKILARWRQPKTHAE